MIKDLFSITKHIFTPPHTIIQTARHAFTSPHLGGCVLGGFLLLSSLTATALTHTYKVYGANIKASNYMTAVGDSAGQAAFEIEPRSVIPFAQQCVSQKRADYKVLAKAAATPYYNVRMALPVPSCYTPTEQGAIVGLDWGVYTHLHSAGMEIMPNGDILAIYFSTPVGKAEADTCTTFVQCRRRYGSDEWDMPELLFKTRGGNDQSALLMTDNDTVFFFGGGRDMTDYVPFRILKSTDNGATWTFYAPQMDKKLEHYTAQPISNAFRNKQGEIFVAIDGDGPQSLLLRSKDGGIHWHDMGGRTNTRHSTIAMLDDNGTLLSAGGKNNNIDNWNIQNISTDWGATWSEGTKSFFPPEGTAQRPCMIRLQSGALCLVSDSYQHKKKIAPPKDWQYGNECFVAISRDNGKTWKIKTLPVTLPQHHRVAHPSLGYCTLRQGQDGLIHILTTTNYPGLEIEFNEAWIDDTTNTKHPTPNTQHLTSNTLYGKQSAITPLAKSGYYCLNGTFTDKFADGSTQHVVTYKNGKHVGTETLYRPDGTKVWEWVRDTKTNTARWSNYRGNGKVHILSRWKLNPEPRDLPGVHLNGCVADMYTWEYDKVGMQTEAYRFNDGVLDGSDKQGTNSAILNEGK